MENTGALPGAEAAEGGAGVTETLVIDGREPISEDQAERVRKACDAVEAGAARRLVLRVGGAPAGDPPRELSVGVVSRWERALRRLERLPAPTAAVAEGDCSGTALDVLLTADYRVLAPGTRLIVPLAGGATWPGMAVYRLANQGSMSGVVRNAVLYGTPIEAVDAAAAHLVDEVTADVEGALARVDTLSSALAGAEVAIRRQLLLEAATVSFEESLGVHLAACDRVLRQAASGVTP